MCMIVRLRRRGFTTVLRRSHDLRLRPRRDPVGAAAGVSFGFSPAVVTAGRAQPAGDPGEGLVGATGGVVDLAAAVDDIDVADQVDEVMGGVARGGRSSGVEPRSRAGSGLVSSPGRWRGSVRLGGGTAPTPPP